jgi:glycosyltransferase involved in cell wall biosynthesis
LARLALAGLRRRVGKVYREADIVSGVSERYRQLSGREDFFLAYHGIETPSPRCATHVADGTLRLVYAGNLGVGYDLGTVMEGVRMLRESGREVRLEIAGNGPLEARWRRLAGPETVFHGYIGSRELTELMSRCDAGVIPLKDESWVGLPYKLGDYAAAGLPVLTSLGGECAELAERFRSGLRYRPGDAKSFADAVRALASGAVDPQGPASLAATLSAGRIYDGYVDVVESVADAGSGRGRGKNG